MHRKPLIHHLGNAFNLWKNNPSWVETVSVPLCVLRMECPDVLAVWIDGYLVIPMYPLGVFIEYSAEYKVKSHLPLATWHSITCSSGLILREWIFVQVIWHDMLVIRGAGNDVAGLYNRALWRVDDVQNSWSLFKIPSILDHYLHWRAMSFKVHLSLAWKFQYEEKVGK